MSTPRDTSPQLIAITLVLSAGMFFVDLSLPRGFAGGIPYVALVLLGWWHHSRRYIIILAALFTLLVLLGYLFSPPGSAEWMVISNRVMAVMAIWITSALLVLARRAQEVRLDREKRLSLILDNSVTGIITMGENGLIESINPAVEQIFGYSKDELTGRDISQLMPEPYRSRHAGYIARYLRTGEARIIGIGREAEGLHKDGRRFPIELGVSEMMLDGRRVFTGMVQDISKRKQTEDDLRQALKMEAVGQLTGGMAHDFNNLLAVYISNLEMLKDQLPPEGDAARMARRALQAAEQGALLTDRLLAFSRKQQLQPTLHQLNHLISGMAGLLRSSLGAAISVKLQLAADLWPTYVDAGQLENALLNLALNARDAMNGGGTLTVETANTTLDQDYARSRGGVVPGDYVVLSVIDTGVGMAAEMLEHVFEPFFTTKDAGEGSGLGLSMVYGFASQSGGHAAIESESGEGTSVRIYLPRALGEAPTGPPAPAPAEDIMAPAPAGNSKGPAQTVLVVEDYDDLRDTAVELFASFGFTALEARDGHAALGVLEKNPQVALLFTDVVLPGGMSGIDLAHEARGRYPELKVLLTSGYTAHALAAGARNSMTAGARNSLTVSAQNSLAAPAQISLAASAQNSLAASAAVASEFALIEKPYKLADLSRKVGELLKNP